MTTVPNLVEVPRKSLYDVIRENLNHTGRETFIHRIMTIGEHELGLSHEWGIGECFRSTVEDVNEHSYNNEKLTGLLLCYPTYFCQITDGPEFMLNRFLKILMDKYGLQIKNFKILANFHHIHARVFDTWTVITGKPPRLYGRIKQDADIGTTFKYVRNCINKLFSLCSYVKHHSVQQQDTDLAASFETRSLLSFDYSSLTDEIPGRSSSSHLTVPRVSVAGTGSVADKYRWKDTLPEYGLIEFLLQSPYLQNVEDVLKKVNNIPDSLDNEDLVWPIPQLLIPDSVLEQNTELYCSKR